MKEKIFQIKNICDMYVQLSKDNAKAQTHVKRLISRLEKTELERGNPSWKYDKYGNALLRVVRPSQDLSESREFVYIGANPHKIAETYAAINRWQQRQRLARQLGDLIQQKTDLDRDIENFERSIFRDLKAVRQQVDPNAMMKSGVDLSGGIDQLDLETIRPAKRTG